MENTQFELNISFYQQLIRQIPGLIVVMDTNSKFIYSNAYTARMFGYKTEEQMIGIDAYGMRCPAVECAEQFIEQDVYARDNTTELTMLDIHGYADNEQKILLTKKAPFTLNGELKGSICHCTEIFSTSLAKISVALIDLDKKFHEKTTNDERTYTINKVLKHTKLSRRELDCVFYLLRGKTNKEIAKHLNLSSRTVESYLQNIKFKWQCEKKSHIIDYAVVNGYLGYIPEHVFGCNVSNILHQVKPENIR